MGMRPRIGPQGRGRPLIVALDHVDAGALPLVGGKAANLGELIAAGLPVPAGFCVTTEAYRDVATAAELAEILDRLAATPAPICSAKRRRVSKPALLPRPRPSN